MEASIDDEETAEENELQTTECGDVDKNHHIAHSTSRGRYEGEGENALSLN